MEVLAEMQHSLPLFSMSPFQQKMKSALTWRELLVAIRAISRNMWQQNPEQAQPIISIASHELPLPDLITLFSRHPVLPWRCFLYAVGRALMHLGLMLGFAHPPAVAAPDEWIVVSKNMRPSKLVRDPFQAREYLVRLT